MKAYEAYFKIGKILQDECEMCSEKYLLYRKAADNLTHLLFPNNAFLVECKTLKNGFIQFSVRDIIDGECHTVSIFFNGVYCEALSDSENHFLGEQEETSFVKKLEKDIDVDSTKPIDELTFFKLLEQPNDTHASYDKPDFKQMWTSAYEHAKSLGVSR